MPKRKRDGSESPDVEEQGQDNQQVSLRTRRVEAKLVHGQKLLARAFKTARGFERQKLGRRRKTAAARSDAKDVARIDAETAALKTLDLNKAATNYLNKSLLKFKTVAESPALPKSVLKPAQVPQDTATLNVVARLCSANPTKEALPDILRDIQLALGIQVSKDVGKGKGKVKTKEHLDKAQSRKAVKPEEESENSEEETDDLEDVPLPKKRARETRENEDEDEEASDADSGEEEVAYAAFDARIAGSDDEDEAEEDEEEQDPMAISSDEDTYTRLNKRASPPSHPHPRPPHPDLLQPLQSPQQK
ncbi:hypothetical protein H2203_007951 [Taxawa tesnikishii (nom. ined.)]|nr:hypothetical protein H2203_007951 [Dothideales sp. JES 119]